MSRLDQEDSSIPPAKRLLVRVVLLSALGLLVAYGADALRFLCDDAFITFRYVSNAMDGRGLVWNPAPFAPVEGYTSFSWALVLWAAWGWLGCEPPDCANTISVACGLLTFAIVSAAAFRLRDRAGRKAPEIVVFATLAAIAGNRVFLQWMTSGLETALYNLVFVTWVVLAWRPPARQTTAWWVAFSAAAASTALTRPDGLVHVGATAACAAVAMVRCRTNAWRVLVGLSPLLLVVAHVAWRRWFYGEWLPNTYYAKVAGAWPEAGFRYLGLFLLENGGWIVVPFAAIWAAAELRRSGANVVRVLLHHLPRTAAVGVTLFLVCYYVVIVGGDHFEFRVFSHLTPLAGLAVAAMALRLWDGVARSVAVLVSIAIAGGLAWWIPAVQPPTTWMYEPLAPHVSGWLRPVARWYDHHRAWLSSQAVGSRCDQHMLFLALATEQMPDRVRGAFAVDDVPIHVADCVGRVGWVMPDVAVIDALGLNDRIAARWPMPPKGREPAAVREALAAADADRDGRITSIELEDASRAVPGPAGEGFRAVMRQIVCMFGDSDGVLHTAELPAISSYFESARRMAHDRRAPAGYVAAFDPNVTVEGRRLIVRQRALPIDADRVRAIEAEWLARVRTRRWDR